MKWSYTAGITENTTFVLRNLGRPHVRQDPLPVVASGRDQCFCKVKIYIPQFFVFFWFLTLYMILPFTQILKSESCFPLPSNSQVLGILPSMNQIDQFLLHPRHLTRSFCIPNTPITASCLDYKSSVIGLPNTQAVLSDLSSPKDKYEHNTLLPPLV